MTQLETIAFAECVSEASLTELPFSGSCYTWWNGRIGEDNIFIRLDRVFG